MTAETEFDVRASDAGDQIREVVALPIAEPSPRSTRTPRAVGVVVAGVAVVSVVVAMVVPGMVPWRHGTARSQHGSETSYFVPRFVPDGVRLIRAEVTPSLQTSVAVFASTPKPDAPATLIQVSRLEDASSDPTDQCSVRGVGCTYDELVADNGVTWRFLSWFEGYLSVGLQSTATDRAGLFSAAAELQIANGIVANKTIGGLPRTFASSNTPTIRVLADRNRPAALTLNIITLRGDPPTAFIPGDAVDINGIRGWLTHSRSGTNPSAAAVGVIGWNPSTSVTLSLSSITLSDDELLRIARSVAPATATEWEQIPVS